MKNTIAVVAILLVILAGAQTIVAPTNTWFTMLNEIKFAKKWSISFETHERFGGIFKDQGQFLFHFNQICKNTEYCTSLYDKEI